MSQVTQAGKPVPIETTPMLRKATLGIRCRAQRGASNASVLKTVSGGKERVVGQEI